MNDERKHRLLHTIGEVLLRFGELAFGSLVLGTVITGDLSKSVLLVAGGVIAGIATVAGVLLVAFFKGE